MRFRLFGRMLLAAALLCLATATATAQQYNMVVLGPCGTSTQYLPYAGLNNQGDVVGYNSQVNSAVIYRGGAITSLGLGHAAGTAINNLGQVALYSSTSFHSYLFDPAYAGRLVDLGTLGGGGGLHGGGVTSATAMNDRGTIVGSSSVPGTVHHAFVYANGSISDLGSLGGDSTASGINNFGQIVGTSTDSNGYQRAFQMINGTMTDLDPSNPAYDSVASGINDSGQIVVVTNKAWHLVQVSRNKLLWVAYRGPYWYTLLYSGGRYTDLGNLGTTLGTQGGSINTGGDVVGFSYSSPGVQHAFLYHAGHMLDLNSHVNNLAGWTLWSANNINDWGQIVCFGHGPDGVPQIVLLIPEGIGV